MNETQMLDLLRGPTTERVLEAVLITIGGSVLPSGVVPYFVKKDDLPIHGKESFRIADNAGIVGANAHQFNAHSIQMIRTANVPPLNQIVGYVLDHTGPNLMVTGMLTGCTFVMKANANRTAVRCAHLQPAQNMGADLNIRCVNTAAFVGDAGPVRAFGRLKYADNTACTVIGVRRPAGAWDIYAQLLNRDNNQYRISDVEKIL